MLISLCGGQDHHTILKAAGGGGGGGGGETETERDVLRCTGKVALHVYNHVHVLSPKQETGLIIFRYVFLCLEEPLNW